jgi:hypothetical protein
MPQPKGKTTVNWYEYIACFFAGMFLANVVPHFVHGISGERFPTPFTYPRERIVIANGKPCLGAIELRLRDESSPKNIHKPPLSDSLGLPPRWSNSRA